MLPGGSARDFPLISQLHELSLSLKKIGRDDLNKI